MAIRETQYYLLDEDGYLLCTLSARTSLVSMMESESGVPDELPNTPLASRRRLYMALVTEGGYQPDGIDVGSSTVEKETGFPVTVGDDARIRQVLVLDAHSDIRTYVAHTSVEFQRSLELR
ncbi:MAG: hypothetical protein KatS3mg015_0973 [Fimbriimonadales bacterium]|nr:MAG: hypothetical protein KatS3mg015_0973 [Fimbriimonadales bacterium]